MIETQLCVAAVINTKNLTNFAISKKSVILGMKRKNPTQVMSCD